MYYVYIIKCSDNTLYTGYTNDIDKRIEKHNQGLAAKYTRGRTPVKLMYYEEFESKNEALKRELQIKSFPRHKKISLIEMR